MFLNVHWAFFNRLKILYMYLICASSVFFTFYTTKLVNFSYSSQNTNAGVGGVGTISTWVFRIFQVTLR